MEVFTKAMRKILKLMKFKKNRKARFVCNLSIKLSEKNSFTFEGRVEGKIAFSMLGKKGFGYDPIFIPTGSHETFGQMSKRKN